MGSALWPANTLWIRPGISFSLFSSIAIILFCHSGRLGDEHEKVPEHWHDTINDWKWREALMPEQLEHPRSIDDCNLIICAEWKFISVNFIAWRRRRGYWTPVLRVENSPTFYWCNNVTAVDFPLSSPHWASGAPTLTENNACVHGRLLRYNATFALFNAPCNKRFLWSCQVYCSL